MRAFGLILVAPLALALAGCELIAAVDHDLIGSGGSGAGPSTGGAGGTGGAGAGPVGGEGGTPVVGGMGGEGGSGGAPECTTPERCPDPAVCQTVECNNENCEDGPDVADGTACEISPGVDGVCFEGTAAAGDGSCVECLVNTDCTAPDTCDTTTHQCEGPLCSNLVQDVGETGIDCGGPSCGACDNTQGCLVATDCISGFCNLLQCDPCTMNNQCAGNQWCDTTLDGGTCVPDKANGQACTGGGGECISGNCNPIGGGTSMCCDVPCAGTCRSCGAADTGGTNGTCDDILVNTDPKNQCNTVAGDCNSGECSGGTGCGFKAANAPCDDTLFCTDTDTCNAGGTCVGTGNPCAGHNTGPSCDDSCNEATNDCTLADVATTPCDEDADLANGACDGTLTEPNCAGD